MAYSMTVHTPLGSEKFLLHLPDGDNGSAHMFKGKLDFEESAVSENNIIMLGATNTPFECIVKIVCSKVDNGVLGGVVDIIDSFSGKSMLTCPIYGEVSDGRDPWSKQ